VENHNNTNTIKPCSIEAQTLSAAIDFRQQHSDAAKCLPGVPSKTLKKHENGSQGQSSR